MDVIDSVPIFFGIGLKFLILFLDIVLRIVALYLSVLAIRALKTYLKERN